MVIVESNDQCKIVVEISSPQGSLHLIIDDISGLQKYWLSATQRHLLRNKARPRVICPISVVEPIATGKECHSLSYIRNQISLFKNCRYQESAMHKLSGDLVVPLVLRKLEKNGLGHHSKPSVHDELGIQILQ